jgi:D-serine deaminase-like pyridoxal phosphate-dependent protein
VNVGTNRCGADPGEPALKLCQQVAAATGLRFAGLMGYEGFAVHIKDRAEREVAGRGAMKKMLDTKMMVEAAGLPVEIVSGVGTGTYDISGRVSGVTEVQAGSYATMDTTYKRINPEFEYALTVLCTVISRPSPTIVITDSGLKSITTDFGLPEVAGIPGAKLVGLSEEHGKIELAGPSDTPAVGDKIQMIPSHGCTTINLHDCYYPMRKGKLQAIWDITGRGRFR